jgi:anti-sigma factor RsiW
MCPTESELIRLLRAELPPARTQQIQSHLSQCESCRATIAELQQIWDALGLCQPTRSPARPDDDMFVARVVHAARLEQLKLLRRPAIAWQRAKVAAAILLAAGAGVLAGSIVPVSSPSLHPSRVAVATPPSTQQLAESFGFDALGGESTVLAWLYLDAEVVEPGASQAIEQENQ